jgi:hypothetical protein
MVATLTGDRIWVDSHEKHVQAWSDDVRHSDLGVRRFAPRRAPRRGGGLEQTEDLPFVADFSEAWPLTCIDGSKSGPSDMCKDQAPHTASLSLARDVEHTCMAAAPSEADGPSPTSAIGKEQVGSLRPLRELEELRRPDGDATRQVDSVAVGRARRMHHGLGMDTHGGSAHEVADLWREVSETSKGADLPDQLRARIGHEPRVQALLGFGTRTAIDHRAVSTALDQQPRWRETW